MNNIIQQEAILAELADAKNMLATTPDFDFVGRMSFEARVEVLEEELAAITLTNNTQGEVIIYFGGDPVQGSDSISTTFASTILSKFQDVISLLFASKKQDTEISESGIIPFSKESELCLAGTPRGSFGFILKENNSQTSLVDTELQKAIDSINNILELSVNQNKDELLEIIATLPARTRKSVYDFITYINKSKASLTIQTKNKTVVAKKNSLKNIEEFFEVMQTVTTRTKDYVGIFQGALLESKKFEFLIESENQSINGLITKDIDKKHIAEMNINYTDKKCQATLKCIQTKNENTGKIKDKWILDDIRPLEA